VPTTVADALSLLDIDILKIQDEEEESLTLLSRSENSSIISIKYPMHTALICKEKAKVKEPGLRENRLAQPHYSLQYIERYNLLFYKENKQYLHSSIIEKKQRLLSWYHEYLLHPGQTRTEKTVRNTMIWPGLTQDVEH
jgi:hypothetical protein